VDAVAAVRRAVQLDVAEERQQQREVGVLPVAEIAVAAGPAHGVGPEHGATHHDRRLLEQPPQREPSAVAARGDGAVGRPRERALLPRGVVQRDGAHPHRDHLGARPQPLDREREVPRREAVIGVGERHEGRRHAPEPVVARGAEAQPARRAQDLHAVGQAGRRGRRGVVDDEHAQRDLVALRPHGADALAEPPQVVVPHRDDDGEGGAALLHAVPTLAGRRARGQGDGAIRAG
jgi:hypothetical protein